MPAISEDYARDFVGDKTQSQNLEQAFFLYLSDFFRLSEKAAIPYQSSDFLLLAVDF